MAWSMADTLASMFRQKQRLEGGLREHAVRVGDDAISFLARDRPNEKTSEADTIVLVHGFGADKDSWTMLAPHLPRRYRLIIPDLAGFGDSSRHHDQRYDVPSQARRLAAFLDALALRSVHVVASSMGGNIVARLAIDDPGRFRSLTLMAPLGVLSAEPSPAERELAAGRNPLIVESEADFDHLIELVFVDPPHALSQRMVRRYLAEHAMADSQFARKIFSDLQSRPDWLQPDELAKIVAPTLLVWGDDDRVIPIASAAVWKDNMPRARIETLARCGHAPMAERPLESALALVAFLQELHTPTNV
jgi:abhydrolase domain-containing protein 6